MKFKSILLAYNYGLLAGRDRSTLALTGGLGFRGLIRLTVSIKEKCPYRCHISNLDKIISVGEYVHFLYPLNDGLRAKAGY